MGNCLVCGSNAYVRIYKLKSIWETSYSDFDIVKCKGCGFMTISPMPTEQELGTFYKEFSSDNYANVLNFKEYIQHDAIRALINLERFFPAKGKLLDIGCGLGIFLAEARNRGWEVCGVEASTYAADYVTNELGIKVLAELSIEECSQDVIVLSQVLEHLVDPYPLLEKIEKSLVPGGILYIITPNFKSLLAKLKKESFNYWTPPEHVNYYNPSTIEKLLLNAGYAPVEVNTVGHGFDCLDLLGKTKIPFGIRRILARLVEPLFKLAFPMMGSMVEIYARKK